MIVRFYNPEDVDVSELKYVVIIAEYQGKLIFCRHRSRVTYECPGGHIESGESADDAAARELFEETGAVRYTLTRICAYKAGSFGMLYHAYVDELGELPESEIAEIRLFDEFPEMEKLTYPDIQPFLNKKYREI